MELNRDCTTPPLLQQNSPVGQCTTAETCRTTERTVQIMLQYLVILASPIGPISGAHQFSPKPEEAPRLSFQLYFGSEYVFFGRTC